MPHPPPPQLRSRTVLPLILAALTVASACGGGAPTEGTAPAVPASASEAEWRALATPRPEPLDGAPRVTVGTVEILASPDWPLARGVDPSLAVAELAAAGLLEQRHVRFVERRRFARAAEAERRGLPRPEDAPPAGVSPGAQLSVSASWASLGLDSAYLDLRLTEVATGSVVATRRVATATDADAVAVARTLVSNLMVQLDAEGRLPRGTDEEGLALAAPTLQARQVPPAAVAAFATGLAAEEAWRWEEARRGYQEALARADGLFPEARAALARTARLRTGGTLGES